IGADELEATYDGIGPVELADTRAEIAGHGWNGKPDERGIRVAAALRSLAEKYDAVCGAVNCHGPLLRRNERIGVPACLGVSVCTAAGVPLACMADVPTAVALTLGRILAGRVLYCEFYSPEPDTGMLLIANGGEGDA